MLVSQMKSNNCSCHISLSECKVKLHVFTGQNNSAASGALYVQISPHFNKHKCIKMNDQSIFNFVLFY